MVYIIILNYNGWRDTIECLQSLLLLENINFNIVVIDNNSRDESVKEIMRWMKSIITPLSEHIPETFQIENSTRLLHYKLNTIFNGINELTLYKSINNKGYSGGNNIGIKHALFKEDAAYVWLLNNDTLVKKNTLTEMLKLYTIAENNNVKLGMVGCKLLYYSSPNIIQCLGGAKYNSYTGIVKQINNNLEDNATNNVKQTADYIPGTSLLLKIDFIKDIGLLNEEYFLYFEELDLMARSKIKDWKIDYTMQGAVLHKEGGTISKENTKEKSPLSDYCLLRSKILYTRQYENIICNITIYAVIAYSLIRRLVTGQLTRFITMLSIIYNPYSKEFLKKI